MTILFSGLLIWSIVHLVPALAPTIKSKFSNSLGENGFKLLFTALIVLSIFMMVYGWRHSTTELIYTLPKFIYPISTILMALSFILFASTIIPTRLLLVVRHPQLLFVLLWSIAHLIANGDSRSILLFAGMGIWAILEIILIDKRDGKKLKIAKMTLTTELKSIVLSAIIFVSVVYAHKYLSGISLL